MATRKTVLEKNLNQKTLIAFRATGVNNGHGSIGTTDGTTVGTSGTTVVTSGTTVVTSGTTVVTTSDKSSGTTVGFSGTTTTRAANTRATTTRAGITSAGITYERVDLNPGLIILRICMTKMFFK